MVRPKICETNRSLPRESSNLVAHQRLVDAQGGKTSRKDAYFRIIGRGLPSARMGSTSSSMPKIPDVLPVLGITMRLSKRQCMLRLILCGKGNTPVPRQPADWQLERLAEHQQRCRS